MPEMLIGLDGTDLLLAILVFLSIVSVIASAKAHVTA